MKLFVTVKPNAKENRVEKMDATHFKVWVKAPAQEGRANQAVIEVLAEALRVPKSRLGIIRGESSKTKVIRLLA